MMHKAWSSIEEVPYCCSRSSVKFQGHIALKIVEFDSNRAFPDCNSSLNSPMAMKCCTKLEIAKKRCPIVFQGHPSNFKVTRDRFWPKLGVSDYRPVAAFKSLWFALLALFWLEILHADVSWLPSELVRLWVQYVFFFSILMQFWLSETGQIWGFLEFWSCSVDCPHYSDP